MGDLKPLWPDKDLPLATHGLGGDVVISSGSDPNASGGDGPAGLKNFWDDSKQALSETGVGMDESRNSVSGLPSLPNRFEPSDGAVDPPDLTTRNPGTVDKR